MNAKEYLKSIDIPDDLITIQGDGFIESWYLSTLLSKYHQHKSKEEAEEKLFATFQAGENVGYFNEETELCRKIHGYANFKEWLIASGKEER